MCFLSFLLFSALGTADLSGTWNGWADWSFEGSGTHCSTAKFTFTENETTVSRKSGILDCDYVRQEYPETTFTKKNGELWFENQKVGNYTNDKYSWDEIYSSHVNIHVSIERKGNAITYIEKWLNEKSATIYDIEARLFTK